MCLPTPLGAPLLTIPLPAGCGAALQSPRTQGANAYHHGLTAPRRQQHPWVHVSLRSYLLWHLLPSGRFSRLPASAALILLICILACLAVPPFVKFKAGATHLQHPVSLCHIMLLIHDTACSPCAVQRLGYPQPAIGLRHRQSSMQSDAGAAEQGRVPAHRTEPRRTGTVLQGVNLATPLVSVPGRCQGLNRSVCCSFVRINVPVLEHLCRGGSSCSHLPCCHHWPVPCGQMATKHPHQTSNTYNMWRFAPACALLCTHGLTEPFPFGEVPEARHLPTGHQQRARGQEATVQAKPGRPAQACAVPLCR